MPTQADTIENFIADADKALYKAKQTGRNRFVIFESE
jgi:PleD family two-component response regulator